MCFGKKPKMKEPKIQTPQINQAPPIESQTPKVVDGADVADAERNKKKRNATNGALSLFQIQLMPGAATGTDEPGANSMEV